MKESDVQAAMDTQLKVAADGLWYEFPNPPLQLQQLQAFQAEAEQHIIQTAGLNNLPDPTRCAVSGTLLPDNPRRLPDQDQMCQIAAWSDPPSELLNDPTFEAIWQAIKTWDINVPAAYGGYCGATGNHVYAIHRALARLSPPQQPDPGDSLYEECLAVQDEPEILVTTEMLQAAGRAWLECGPVQVEQWTAIYRAMAALAPKNTASKWWPAQWQEGQACIAALEGENVEFKLNNTKLLEAYSSISKKLGELQTEKRNQVGLRIGSMLPGSCDESRPATNERAAAAAENNALTTQMDTLIQAGIQAYRDECTKQIAALGAAFESERNMRITMEDCLRDAQQTALRYKRDLAALEAESAEAKRLVGCWEETARHFSANADYYRGLVDEIGEMFGTDARTADDGGVHDSILRAKVPELVRAMATRANALNAVSSPADLPDPPRRPDGTLVPVSKPWAPPKDTGDKRRIGG